MNKLIRTIIVGGILMAADISFNWNNAAALEMLNRGNRVLNPDKFYRGYTWLNAPTQPGLTNLESNSMSFGANFLHSLGALGQAVVNSKTPYIRQAAYSLGVYENNKDAIALGNIAYANSSWGWNSDLPWEHLTQKQQEKIPLFLMQKYKTDPNFRAVIDEGDTDKTHAYIARYLQNVGNDTDLLANSDSIQNSLAPTIQGTHVADDHAAEVAKKTYEDFISSGLDKGSEVAATLIADNQRKQREKAQQEGKPTDSWYDTYRKNPRKNNKTIEEINQETIKKFGRLI